MRFRSGLTSPVFTELSLSPFPFLFPPPSAYRLSVFTFGF
jgi:hypothetical protein